MEKQMTLTAQTDTRKNATDMMRKSATDVMKKAKWTLNTPMRRLQKYYSHVLGRDVDERETRTMTEAQMAFFAVTLPLDYPLILRIAACAWFIVALKRCKGK